MNEHGAARAEKETGLVSKLGDELMWSVPTAARDAGGTNATRKMIVELVTRTDDTLCPTPKMLGGGCVSHSE